MLYYVMWGTETVAICTRVEDAYAMAGLDYKTGKTYTVVAKLVDTE